VGEENRGLGEVKTSEEVKEAIVLLWMGWDGWMDGMGVARGEGRPPPSLSLEDYTLIPIPHTSSLPSPPRVVG